MPTAVRGELVEPRTAVPCPDFNCALTLASGQVFRWTALGGGSFGGWIGDSLARVFQDGDRLRVHGVSPLSARDFFSLDTDLPAITRQIDVDPVIHQAIRRYPGLRVIRQDPWECTASFLLSAYNNIPRLTGMLETLSRKFGAEVMPGRPRSTYPLPGGLGTIGPSPATGGPGEHVARPERGRARPYSFPRPEVLANVPERVLRNCGLGYRAPYLKAVAARMASGKVDLEKLRGMEDEELRRALLALPGIGEKVAECVMLFAYGRAAAFPVDVWIGRAVRGWYFRRRKVTDRRIREFARKHFGPYCGWAQQVLYCHARWQSAGPSV